jgi:sigma-B regulation protein RsbU (phosphoserine phosphatase)
MPATECAGDWWHYSQHENKLIVWIGDVVGHGAASALLTSAVNSAISILETGERSSISATLARLNTMIFQTTRGSQCMTMQGFEIDLISGLCRVASASHPEPFKVYRSRDHDTKKLVSLMETLPSAMLGASMGSSYTEIEFQISPGERIFLYTDGVSELRNERGDMYGGRRLIKSLDKIGALPGLGAKAFREAFLEEVASFKGEAILEDDLTFIVIQRNQ